jgi:hypothetical protein
MKHALLSTGCSLDASAGHHHHGGKRGKAIHLEAAGDAAAAEGVPRIVAAAAEAEAEVGAEGVPRTRVGRRGWFVPVSRCQSNRRGIRRPSTFR